MDRAATSSGLEALWERYGRMITRLGVLYLAIAATGRLVYALPHLIRDVAPWSALDLKYRYNEVSEWFAGNPVYGVVDGAVYPPASHVILWPFLGWMPLSQARLLWAITILAAAILLGLLVYRLCAGAPPRYAMLLAGLALAAYPLQLTIFTGQLGIHLVAAAAWGAWLLFRDGRPHWWADGLGSLLLAVSLVKPQLSVPLVACALLASRRLRPAILVAGIYMGLTLAAVSLQPDGLLVLVRDWLDVAGRRVTTEGGVPNLHQLLGWAGLRAWMAPASLVTLCAMTAWMWRRRDADPWILMGVAAIVTRFWAHSTLYDDGFLLIAMVALFRVASGSAAPGRRVATGLLVMGWGALLTPTWFFYDLAPVVVRFTHAAQAALWFAVMIVLAASTRVRPRTTTVRTSP